jgi:hypothetical protein
MILDLVVKFPVFASEFPVPKCPNLVSDKDSRLGVLTALRRLAVRMKRLGTQDGGLLRDPYKMKFYADQLIDSYYKVEDIAKKNHLANIAERATYTQAVLKRASISQNESAECTATAI